MHDSLMDSKACLYTVSQQVILTSEVVHPLSDHRGCSHNHHSCLYNHLGRLYIYRRCLLLQPPRLSASTTTTEVATWKTTEVISLTDRSCIKLHRPSQWICIRPVQRNAPHTIPSPPNLTPNLTIWSMRPMSSQSMSFKNQNQTIVTRKKVTK